MRRKLLAILLAIAAWPTFSLGGEVILRVLPKPVRLEKHDGTRLEGTIVMSGPLGVVMLANGDEVFIKTEDVVKIDNIEKPPTEEATDSDAPLILIETHKAIPDKGEYVVHGEFSGEEHSPEKAETSAAEPADEKEQTEPTKTEKAAPEKKPNETNGFDRLPESILKERAPAAKKNEKKGAQNPAAGQ